jgi:phospholipid-binding lipoprotein MlaA
MSQQGAVGRMQAAIVVLFWITLAAGCASRGELRNPEDPFEPVNRKIYVFNEKLDRYVLKPVAQGYQKVVPDVVDRGVTNFFGNITDLPIALNNLLQAKPLDAASDLSRVALNTSFGFFGLVDVASQIGLPKHEEDFGQTFGRWGMQKGPYIVLPVLGPSTMRDTLGLVPDHFTDAVTYAEPRRLRWGLRVVYAIDKRADLLATTRVLEEAALDPYSFTRDAFLQRRRYLVYDGNPPEEEGEEFELLDEEEAEGPEEAPTD